MPRKTDKVRSEHERIGDLEGQMQDVTTSLAAVEASLDAALDSGLGTCCEGSSTAPSAPTPRPDEAAVSGPASEAVFDALTVSLPDLLLNIEASLAGADGARRPRHRDEDGAWTPPGGDADWAPIPLDANGKPNWPGNDWNPDNPNVPANGKVIVEDCDNFQVFCKGIIYSVPWAELCPPAPLQEADRPPRGGCRPYGARRVERTVAQTAKSMFIRRTAACFMQVTCVVTWRIRERTWTCNGRQIVHRDRTVSGSSWTHSRWRERDVIKRRTTYFSCP